jgi:hypothetical protein
MGQHLNQVLKPDVPFLLLPLAFATFGVAKANSIFIVKHANPNLKNRNHESNPTNCLTYSLQYSPL